MQTNPDPPMTWLGAFLVFIILPGIWALAAETIRRAFSRRVLWTVTALLALAVGTSILVSVRPRVAPQPEHPLAYVAVVLAVAAVLVAPTYAVDWGARRSPVTFLRQISFGTLAGAGTFLAAFLVTYVTARLFG